MSPAIRNPRVATLLVFALVVAFAGCGGSPERAVGPTRSQASVSAPPRPAVSPAGAPTPIDELCPGDAGSEPFQVVNVTTSDGVSLYAATIGRGPVGLVMANDVPHPLCEELPEARLFAGHGFRVAVFDYRDRGESGSGGSKPGRLDLDVAAAADLLIRQGSPCVALAGSYGGAAAAIVGAISMRQPPVGLVGFDPAAVRGQYIEGPFGPVGALAAAPKLRIPVLYVTLQNDRYVPLGEVRRLLQATGSATKDLVVVPNGLNGWGLLDGSSSSSRVREAVLSLLRRPRHLRVKGRGSARTTGGYRWRVGKRLVLVLVTGYVTAGVVARLLEARGVYTCGCDPDCWCKRPGLSVFRWVFPRGHKGPWSRVEKMHLAD